VRGAACRRHLGPLIDLVDRGERRPGTDAALDHLATCDRCRDEVTELALTVAALRRAGSVYRLLPAPALVRPLVGTRRRPWAWRAQLGGLITSAGIAALLVAPQVGILPSAPHTEVVDRPTHPPAAAWLAAERRIASTPDVVPRAVVGALPQRYPDGLRPWKEVTSSDAAAPGFVAE
jgi:anti-sigma factor RsiW